MLNNTLKQRRLEVEFILGQDRNTHTQKVFNGLENALYLKGYRISASVASAGGDSGCSANVRIYNVPMQDMNVLSTFGAPVGSVNAAKMRLYAGNVDEEPMSLVYEGYITEAHIEMASVPDVSLSVTSNSSALASMTATQPFSYRGGIAVTTIMQQLAQKASLRFNGNGVDTILYNPYLDGSLRDQIQKCAEMAGIGWIIEAGELAIWPRYGFRKSNFTEISSMTGMVGYPTLMRDSLYLRNIFNPNLIFYQNIQVHSDILGAANGEWTINSLTHTLENDNSNGPWFTEIVACKSGKGINSSNLCGLVGNASGNLSQLSDNGSEREKWMIRNGKGDKSRSILENNIPAYFK